MLKKLIAPYALTLFLVAVTIRAHAGATDAASRPAAPTSAPMAAASSSVAGIDVDRLLGSMNVEQKVGQLLLVDFVGKRMNRQIADLVASKRVGGVALFSHNIQSRTQVRALVSEIRALDSGGVPPFISLDQEGGRVIRIRDPEAVLPSAMALGATRSASLSRTAGKVVGRDLRRLGFTMNLAPVLDVNSNPKNPVIGIRSFGGEPELVAEIGLAFIEGMQKSGIIAVAKHFPGHGATAADSHYGLPSLPYGLERLRRVEFLPFAHAIDGGLEALMTAHIALPKIAEAPDLPSTLSHRILTGALREELGFDGIVITDGLEMRSIVERYGLGPAAVMAVLAGADMVLVVWTSGRKEEVRQALLAAVSDGTISLERLDRSVRRIIAAKARHHMLPGQPAIAFGVTEEERDINNVVALRAATLVRNEGDLLPLRSGRVVIATSQSVFRRLASQRLAGVQVETIPLRWAPTRAQRSADTRRVIKAAATADAVVVGISNRYYAGMVRALKRAHPDTPVMVISFGSPYLLSRFPEVEGYLCLYSGHESAQVAAVETLAGRNPPRGRLPVALPDLYPFGHGLDLPGEEAPASLEGSHGTRTGSMQGVDHPSLASAPVKWSTVSMKSTPSPTVRMSKLAR